MFRRRTFILLFLLLASLPSFKTAAQPGGVNLETGKPVERELTAGKSHAYVLSLPAEQLVRVKTEQKGIDVVVRLLDPRGLALLEIDSPNGTKGDEPLWFVADAAGEYRIVIQSLEKDAPAGKYEITLSESRQATASEQEAMGKLLGNRARSLFNIDSPTARIIAQRALEVGNKIGNKEIVAAQLNLIANTYAVEGDLVNALEFHQRSLAFRKELNDASRISDSMHNMGIVYAMLGNTDKALECFNESFETKYKLGRKVDAAVALYDIGNVYRGKGDFIKAMTYFQKSSDMYLEAGDKGFHADLWIGFAAAYRDQGDYEQALAYFEKARESFERRGLNLFLFATLDGMGDTYFQMGDYRKSIEYLQRALSLEERLQAKPDIIGTLRKIADSYAKLGDYAAADRYYQRALKVGEEQTSVPAVVSLRSAIARLRLTQGKTDEALGFAEQAKSLFETMTGSGTNFELYDILGETYLAADESEKARLSFQIAIDHAERERSDSFSQDESQARFFANRISAYHSLVGVYRSKKQDESAFEIAERAKSRTIVDAIQNGKNENSRALTDAEKIRERELKNDIVSLNTKISKTTATGETLLNLQETLKKKRLEFEDFRTRAYIVHPELRIQRAEMKPITLDEAGTLLPDAKSAFAEFVVASNKIFLFVVTKEGSKRASIKGFSTDIKSAELTKLVEVYREKIANGDLDFQTESREIYNLLLRPAEAQLLGKTNLIIVPDGPLWALPFEPLRNEKNQYLVEQTAVSYAPSLTALREMSKKARSRTHNYAMELIAFGNPIVGQGTLDRVKQVFMGEKLEPLPESERLVNELGKMYGARKSKVYVRDAAQEKAAKTETPKYRIVQFATHGILNNVSPMYSHLVMAQNDRDPNEDGLLEAWEMKDLDLKADMVILSACDTARGKISSGEGVIGMSWALFIAGTPTTVASQWKVESTSTTELMLEFHRQLLSKQHVSKAEALRRAELKVMKMPQFKHPSYWAGFVVVGDGS